MNLQLEVVSRSERLHDLRSEWSERVAQADSSTPFQTPEWLLTWWEHFGSGHLQTLVFSDNGSIVGVVPCFNHFWNGARQLTLVGSGITDYLDPYINGGFAEAIVASIGQYLTCGEYDRCDWQDQSSTSPLLQLRSPSLEIISEPDTICSQVQLGHDFDSYWQNRSSEMRRNVRRYADRAEGAKPLEFSVDCTGDSEHLNSLLTLHTSRWRSRGESGMVEANHSGDFMRQVSAAMAALGALRLFTLKWGEHCVAAILAFSWKGTLYGYFSAFDPEHERLGFGRILLSKCMQYACETGHTHWDFLRGDEAYKKSWGAQFIPKYRILIKPRERSGTA